MTKDDVYNVLCWLENVFPDRIKFSDKMALAEGYMSSEIRLKGK